MDWESVSMSFEQYPQLRYPFKRACKYHLMLEVESDPVLRHEDKKEKDVGLIRLFNFVGSIEEHIIVSLLITTYSVCRMASSLKIKSKSIWYGI